MRKVKDDHDTNSEEYQGLEQCAKDILSAIERKSTKDLSNALKDAFDVMQSMPSETEYEFDTDGDTE